MTFGDGEVIGGAGRFRRGDADNDGLVNLTDGITLLNFLFLNGPAPACAKAADANDDGELNITAALYLFNFLFVNGPALPPPGNSTCGTDETRDDLDCATWGRAKITSRFRRPPVPLASLQLLGIRGV